MVFAKQIPFVSFMCCFKTLFNNEHGYVVRCGGCQQLHVAFGNTLLAFTAVQFHAFTHTVQENYEINRHYYNADIKHIQIATEARTVVLVFSVNELKALISLLNTAKKAIGREQLFVFNNN